LTTSESPSQPDPSEIYIPTTREISKLVTFYLKNVRNHSKDEYIGLFRNIQAMMRRGRVTMNDVSAALQNYAADEYVRSLDQRLRKHIRVFFKEENILQWITPVPKSGKQPEASLSNVDRLTVRNKGVNVPIAVTPAKTYEPDPESDNAL
jgi:hypothetical protein